MWGSNFGGQQCVLGVWIHQHPFKMLIRLAIHIGVITANLDSQWWVPGFADDEELDVT